ncbi:hypothetical protein AAVH_27732 [Aphelenchoides avenae]|nr:hypothetical protein AAVH_27732 [Aphelenchus avenae]
MLHLLAAFAVSAIASATCPQGTFASVDRTSCFAVVVNSLPWRAAENICQVYGGHLASVADCDVPVLRLSVTRSPRVECWLGGRLKEARWNWTDGSELNYTNWAEGEPSISHDRCVAQDSEGTWHARDCQQRKPFICRIPTLPETPTSKLHSSFEVSQ